MAEAICQGLSQCVNALGRHDPRCPADVPDPFRDQLAELMPPHADWCHGEAHAECCGAGDCDCGVAESLHRIAAHEEACVQAAARERAAEELREASRYFRGYGIRDQLIMGYLGRRAAALAQPAEGQP